MVEKTLAVIAGKLRGITSSCQCWCKFDVLSICYNEDALTTLNERGENPLEIARRSEACAEIIGLLSITPEEADSLGWDGIFRLHAPVDYWRSEMLGWIRSRSYADCHKWINEHDDELVREVLKHFNSALLRELACNSQEYSDSLVFLALRMIHHPPSISATTSHTRQHGPPACWPIPTLCLPGVTFKSLSPPPPSPNQ